MKMEKVELLLIHNPPAKKDVYAYMHIHRQEWGVCVYIKDTKKEHYGRKILCMTDESNDHVTENSEELVLDNNKSPFCWNFKATIIFSTMLL